MITQNFMVEFLSKAQNLQGEIKKAEAPKDNKLQFPQFKEVLSSNMDRPALKQAQSKNDFKRDDSRSFDKKDNQKISFRSFKEAAKKVQKADPQSNTTASSKAEAAGNKDEAEQTGKIKKASDSKEDAAVENLAQVLGINQNDLTALLKMLNIKPEELMDASKTTEIADKLSGIMNLTSEQKNTLANIIGSVQKQTAESFEKLMDVDFKPVQEEQATSENELKSKGPEVTVIKDPKADFQDMLGKLKVRLEEIRNKINNDPQALAKEISENLEAIMHNKLPDSADTKVTSSVGSAEKPIQASEKISDASQKDNINAVQPVKVEQNAESDTGKDASNKESKENQAVEKAAAQPESITSEGKNGSNDSQFANLVAAQVNKNAPASELNKVTKDAPVTKSEIINQVVEKAKVVLSGDKSEMVMDLKPDSLGKLSLKVVTERGMVVAHFVAESDQVKQVIETNMQLLKDTLEKQGLAVQGFSVSVGQDSQKQFNRGEWTKQNQKSNNSREVSSGGIRVSDSNVFDNQKRISAYDWSDSSINLTA